MIQNLLSTIRIPVLAVALGAFALPSISYAQNAASRPRARQDRAQTRPQAQRAERIQAMLDQLDLSADQKARIGPVLEDSRKQVREAVQNTSDPEQRREQIRSAMADTRKKINDILTPEQKTKLQELMRQQRAAAATQPAARGDGRGDGRGGAIGRLEEAALSLNLTPEQQTKVKDLSKEYHDEVATILRDNAGNAGAGAGAGRNVGAGRQLRATVQEYRSRLTQLLTPEQTEQFSKKVGEMPMQAKAVGGEGRQRHGNPRRHGDQQQ